MKAKLGSVPLVRSVKYCEMRRDVVGSMQKEFDESPTTLDGWVGAVQAAPDGFSYSIDTNKPDWRNRLQDTRARAAGAVVHLRQKPSVTV